MGCQMECHSQKKRRNDWQITYLILCGVFAVPIMCLSYRHFRLDWMSTTHKHSSAPTDLQAHWSGDYYRTPPGFDKTPKIFEFKRVSY